MDYSILFSLVAVCCTIATSAVAYLAFKRNRRFENENVFFKYKIEGYFFITEHLVDFLDLVALAKTKLEEQQNRAHQNFEIDELLQDATEIDNKGNKLFNVALKYSLILPREMTNNLTTLHNHIMGRIKISDDADKTEYVLKITEEYNGLLDVADKLLDQMRDDLGSDELNRRLSKRLQ